MDADELKAMYADMCQQEMQVRRSAGLGSARTATDYDALGNARLYSATELVGTVMQGDQRVILLVDGLEDQGLTLPLKTTDAIVVDDIERAIHSIGERKALDGTLIAYEIQARG